MLAHPPTDRPRAAREHQPIAADAWEQRRERLTTILAAMADHAMQQATFRCPYKNRHDRCTAQFGCRNQRFPTVSAAGAPASAALPSAPSATASATPAAGSVAPPTGSAVPPAATAAAAAASVAPPTGSATPATAAAGAASGGGLPLCAGDDKLDYRTAWDTGAAAPAPDPGRR